MGITYEHPLIGKLREQIGCPVDWRKHIADEQLCKDLRIYWVKVAEQHQADMEMRFYSRLDVQDVLSPQALDTLTKNCAYWRQRAVAAYSDRVGFLTKLRFATKEEYGKHHPEPGLTREQIIDRSRGDDSLFFPEFLPHLMHILWFAISLDLLNVVENRPLHIYLRDNDFIGASDGQPINTIRFDLDYGKPLAHGHPRLLIPPDAKVLLLNDPDYRNFSNDDYDEYILDIDEPPPEGLHTLPDDQ